MPTNREIFYTIRVRNAASAAVRQLTSDLEAQGTTLKQVARQLQDLQVQAARVGTATSQAARGVTSLAQAARGVADAAKNLTKFMTSMDGVSAKSSIFATVGRAVTTLDNSFRNAQGLGVYLQRVNSLALALAVLQGEMRSTASAAAALASITPPRPARGSRAAGTPPNGTAPPANPVPAASGGSGGGSGAASNQASFNTQLGATQRSLIEMKDRLAGLAALTASAFGARKVLELADAYTRITSQIKLVTTGTQNLSDTYEALLAVANNNRTSLESTSEIYTKFNQATRTLGVSQQDVVDTTDAVSKAVSIFGGNAQSAQAALFQFSQGLASGTLRGEELNSVMEQAPRLAQAIADGLKNTNGSIGIPLGSLRTYAEQGKLTTEAIFNALKNQRPKLEAEFKQTGITIGQAFIVAQNYLTDFVGKADAATGTSKKIGAAILDAVKGLQNPQAVSGIQTALSGFATAVSGALTVVRLLAENLQLVVVAGVALKAISLGPTFAAMGASAGAVATQLLVYNVATRSVAIGASAANIAVAGLNAGLRLLGGPIGIAITVASTALAYWLTQTKASVQTGAELSAVTDRLKDSYDGAANAVKGLTDAERARDQLKLQGIQKSLGDQLKGEVKAVNSALAGGFFEGVDGARLAGRFQPFREEVEAFRKSAQEGKADFDALTKSVSLKAQGNPALQDAARELNEAAEAGRKAQSEYEKTDATLKVLGGTATETQAKIAGLRSTLSDPAPVDGQKALQQAIENLKTIAANVPVLKTQADAQASVNSALEKYGQVQRDLKAALTGNALSQSEYNEKLAEAERVLLRAKDAINGVTQAQRELRDAQQDLGLEGLVDRDRLLGEINIKYDRIIRNLKETIPDQGKLNDLIAGQNALRAQEVGNLDVKFQNGDLRDRIKTMQDEARLLGLTGEAHERASALIQVENAAQRAGVSNIQGMVDAYGKEYDALQKAKDARQTMGDGFNTAVTKYIEDARKLGDESAKMFGSIFDNISDGFVDVIKNGQSGFKSMLDNIANDLLRFASRQLFRSLLSSVFGDGQGGTGSGGMLNGLGSSIMSAFGVRSAPTSAASVASTVANTGVGSALNTAAGTAASGITQLSSAATTATTSFGDIPSQLTTMLKGLGATDAGVAGFLGNVQRESGFDPKAVNPTSGAYGLIQALGPRQKALFEQYGSNPTAEQQVAFIRQELTTTEGATLARLRSASTLSEGTMAGVRYERPEGYADAARAGDLSQVPDFQQRLSYAGRFGSVSSSVPSSSSFSLEGATLNDSTVSDLNNQFESIGNSASGLETSFSQAGNALSGATPQILNGSNGVVASLNAGGSNIGDAFKDVSTDITKSGNSLTSAFENVARGLGNSGSGLGGLFSGLFGGSGTASAGAAIGDYDIAANVMGFHSGGIVGGTSRLNFGAKQASLWADAPRFHTGGIVGGLKSRERAIIAKDDEAVFPTVRMSDGSFGVRATGFNGGGGGGGGAGNITFGDINIQTSGSSGNAQQDDQHAKSMGREVKEALRAMVREELMQNMRGGGAFTKGITR